jgi:hypothetical protein
VQGDKHLIRGYHYGYYQYSSFFSRNFAQLIIIFAYITVVLSAMQVVMSIDGVKDDPRLQRASYGFSVFSMVLVAAISGVVVFLVLLFGYHLSATALAHVAIQRGNNIDKTGKKTC